MATDVLNISINISNGSSNAVGTNALSTRVEDVAYINFVNITFPSQMIFTNFTQPNQTFNLTMQSHNDTNQSCQLFINATSFANSTISTSNASGAASYTMNGTKLRQLNTTWENNTEHYVAVKCIDSDGVATWSHRQRYMGVNGSPAIHSVTFASTPQYSRTGGTVLVRVNVSSPQNITNITVGGKRLYNASSNRILTKIIYSFEKRI